MADDECPSCGSAYNENVDPDTDMTVDDWLECFRIPKYLAKIPLGHFLVITGEEFWKDGEGRELTYEEYKTVHNIDPRIAWQAKKEYLKLHGGGVHIGGTDRL